MGNLNWFMAYVVLPISLSTSDPTIAKTVDGKKVTFSLPDNQTAQFMLWTPALGTKFTMVYQAPALVPPILIHNTTLVSEMTPLQDLATSGFNYDPISIVLWLSVVCVVLGITTIILAVYLCFIKNCKKPQTFDIHELPALGVRARQDMLKTSEVGSRNNEAFNTQLVDSEPPPPYTPYSVPSNSYCGPRTTP
ncbi:hypothetical protein Hamer_G026508 [Homarus americanus]|uniref:Uncharacterized protein n=1 Tax=Homarus americanus TaxID=6706 RepID=A0A8J5TN73_HOMAM|nr:hypothetical protein Hamer_G026508 [Homarus americanus]